MVLINLNYSISYSLSCRLLNIIEIKVYTLTHNQVLHQYIILCNCLKKKIESI